MTDIIKTVLAIVGPAIGLGGVIYGAGRDSERQEVRVELKTHVAVEEEARKALRDDVSEVKEIVKDIRRVVEQK